MCVCVCVCVCIAQNVKVKAYPQIRYIARTYFINFRVFYRFIYVITRTITLAHDEALKIGVIHLLYGMF